MQRLGDSIDRYSTARSLILAIIVAAVSVSVMGYLTQTLVYDVYGEANMPDTNLSYTYEQIMEAFGTLGPEGLLMWLQVHLLDLIFPLGYGFAMAIGIALLAKRAFPGRIELRTLALIPLLGAIADYIENGLIATQILAYPAVSQLVVAVASVVTTLKWGLIYLGFVVILVLVLVVIWMRVRG
ncbi:hypothetical protein EU520_00090 [Candidatus Thorarchaeota archaeon]|nr:MAG: hypothetical protein EU520_00090 [Candidatus Thorarchaeota archaeon]